MRRESAAAALLVFALCACGGGPISVLPRGLADANPVPTGCPTKVCGHSPSPSPEPSDTEEPQPAPTQTGSTGSGSSPRPRASAGAGASSPSAKPSASASPGAPGAAPPAAGGRTFAAFRFGDQPFSQPFPIDPPPPPAPIAGSVPAWLASLAFVLVLADVAAHALGFRRRRAIALRR